MTAASGEQGDLAKYAEEAGTDPAPQEADEHLERNGDPPPEPVEPPD